MELHKIYQNPEYKFLLLGEKKKEPLPGTMWLEENYQFNDKKVISHIGNIGFISGNNQVRVLDIDNVLIANDFLEKSRLKTFIVKTNNGMHFYIKSNYNKNLKLENGELRCINQYVVCADSVHPSGKKYEVIKDEEICYIDGDELIKLLKRFNLIRGEIEGKNLIYKQFDKPKKEIEEFILPKLSEFVQRLITEKINKEELNHIGFKSRSERDAKIISSLLNSGYHNYIFSIFKHFSCGDKFREHKAGEIYLQHTIKSQADFLGLRNEEELDLEFDIENQNEKWLKSHITKYLKRISKIKDDDWFFKETLIGTLAYRLKIGRAILEKKMLEIVSKDIPRETISMVDLLNKEKTNIQYLISPIISEGSLNLIGGKSESTKSLFVQTFITSLMLNGEFMGFKKEKDFKVLLYSVDDSSTEMLKNRIHFITEGLKKQHEDNLDFSILKNFHIETKFDKKNIQRELSHCQNYDVIIFDAYRRFLDGSENDSEVVDKFFEGFLKILKEMGKTLIIIHHLKKGKLSEMDEEDFYDLFRGSSDIIAQFDFAIALERSQIFADMNTEEQLTFDVKSRIVKNRLALPITTFAYNVFMDRNEEYTLFRKVELSKITTPKKRREGYIVKILKGKSMNRKDIVDELVSIFSCSDLTIDKDLKDLVKAGVLENIEKGVYKLVENEIKNMESDNDGDEKQKSLF